MKRVGYFPTQYDFFFLKSILWCMVWWLQMLCTVPKALHVNGEKEIPLDSVLPLVLFKYHPLNNLTCVFPTPSTKSWCIPINRKIVNHLLHNSIPEACIIQLQFIKKHSSLIMVRLHFLWNPICSPPFTPCSPQPATSPTGNGTTASFLAMVRLHFSSP